MPLPECTDVILSASLEGCFDGAGVAAALARTSNGMHDLCTDPHLWHGLLLKDLVAMHSRLAVLRWTKRGLQAFDALGNEWCALYGELAARASLLEFLNALTMDKNAALQLASRVSSRTTGGGLTEKQRLLELLMRARTRPNGRWAAAIIP